MYMYNHKIFLLLTYFPWHYIFFCLFLVGSGFELRASAFAKQALYYLSRTSSPFCFGYLEVESNELFAWAGLELWSSQSQPIGYISRRGISEPHGNSTFNFLRNLLFSWVLFLNAGEMSPPSVLWNPPERVSKAAQSHWPLTTWVQTPQISKWIPGCLAGCWSVSPSLSPQLVDQLTEQTHTSPCSIYCFCS
jgi:hypothetical protein